METTSICRICLIYGVKSFNSSEYHALRDFYETLTGIQIEDDEEYDFCYECTHLLKSYDAFKQKCIRGSMLMAKLISGPDEDLELSKNDLLQERIAYNLVSKLGASNNNANKRPIFETKSNCNKARQDMGLENHGQPADKEIGNPKLEEIIKDLERLKQTYCESQNIADSLLPPLANGRSVLRPIDNAENINILSNNHNNNSKIKHILLNNYIDLYVRPESDDISSNMLKSNSQVRNSNTVRDVDSLYSNLRMTDDVDRQISVLILTDDDIAIRMKTREMDEAYLNAEFKCDMCFTYFKSKLDLERHLTFHDESRGAFVCKWCKKRFSMKLYMKNHVLVSHKLNGNQIRTTQIVPMIRDTIDSTQEQENDSTVALEYGLEVSDVGAFAEIETQDFNLPTYGETTTQNENSTPTANPTAKAKKRKRSRYVKKVKPSVRDVGFATCFLLAKEEQMAEWSRRLDMDIYRVPKHKCDKCYRAFHAEEVLKEHNMKHDVNYGPYECQICYLRFTKRCNLRLHSYRHSRRYVCKICKHVSDTCIRAKAHYRLHKGYIYKCLHCSATFGGLVEYNKHVKIHKTTDNTCGVCLNKFKDVQVHLQEAHEELLKPVSENYCTECDVEFDSTQAFDLHKLTCSVHNEDSEYSKPCVFCGDSFEDDVLFVTHANTHIDVPMECEECGLIFPTANKMAAHIRCVHRERRSIPLSKKSFVCEVCGLAFLKNLALVYHQRVHTGEKPYECEVCHMKFKVRGQLTDHLSVHTGEKPYSCALCHRSFRKTGSLNRHMTVHTGLRRYECHFCGKTFAQVTGRKTHMLKMHLNEPKKRGRRNKIEVDI